MWNSVGANKRRCSRPRRRHRQTDCNHSGCYFEWGNTIFNLFTGICFHIQSSLHFKPMSFICYHKKLRFKRRMSNSTFNSFYGMEVGCYLLCMLVSFTSTNISGYWHFVCYSCIIKKQFPKIHPIRLVIISFNPQFCMRIILK